MKKFLSHKGALILKEVTQFQVILMDGIALPLLGSLREEMLKMFEYVEDM